MQNASSNELIQKIKEGLRLESYMEECGVEIVRKNKDSWTARCWAHPDKTPSLSISLGKSLYYCHSTGCGLGGDILCYHEQYFHVDRGQAIRDLAGRIGLSTKDHVQSDEDRRNRRAKEIMQEATEECALALLQNTKALSYVRSRGVSEDTISEFQIGYAKEPLICHSSSDQDVWRLLELDSFKYRDALILPAVCPITGNIAHYVRPFRATKSGLKYMGPASSNPSRWTGMQFGLNVARRYASERVVLVEGQFDCLTLHSYGFRNVVSTLGSHPSIEQLKLLTQLHIRNATVLFDADPAGSAGASACIRQSPRGLRISVAIIPAGDPDEYVMQEGAGAMETVLRQALPPADFIINKWKEVLNGNSNSISEGLDGAIAELAVLSTSDRLAGLVALSRLSGISVKRLEDIEQETKPDNRTILESERQVLAMCIKNPEYVHLLERIPEEAWTLAKHRAIAEKLRSLLKQGASKITEDLIGPDFKTLSLIDPSNFEYHVSQIREAHTRRMLADAGRKLLQSAHNPRELLQDVVSMHLQNVSQSASSSGAQSEFTASQIVEDAMSYIHDRIANPDTIPGIDLGQNWKNITKATLGFQKNRLYLVGAGPKVGKTSLALNWALACAVGRKVPTLWVNLEMSERDLMMRLFSISSGVSALRVQAGALQSKEKQVLDAHAAEIYASPFHVVNGFGMTVQEIIAVMRKYVYMHQTALVFIDYIQLLNVNKGQNLDYWERHAMVSTALKEAINGDIGVPVIALSQLGRPASAEGSSSGSFIGGSYKYVQDCDAFMGLRVRTDKELEDGQGGNLILNIEYNRHGPQDVYTRVHFNRDNLKMQEIE